MGLYTLHHSITYNGSKHLDMYNQVTIYLFNILLMPWYNIQYTSILIAKKKYSIATAAGMLVRPTSTQINFFFIY